jgi:hypothetical protein
MSTIYAATYVEKLASKDTEENGCETKSRTLLSESINVVAKSLKELVTKIKAMYGYDHDYLFIPQNGFVGWNCNEDDDSNSLDAEDCKRLWKAGKNVWLCDYSFSIEKRVVNDVTVDELKELASSGYQVEA